MPPLGVGRLNPFRGRPVLPLAHPRCRLDWPLSSWAPCGTGCRFLRWPWVPAALAVVVNLLAAGGIGIPTVALGLWSMLALGLNLRDDRSCGRLREYDSRIPAFVLAVVWAAVLGTFAGEVCPFWRSEAYMAEADEAIKHQPPNYERAEAATVSACHADRLSARPLLKLASLSWMVSRERGGKV